MELPERLCNSAEKYRAARNALLAKYTYEHLGKDQKQKIDEHIVDMLILSGIDAARAAKYRCQLRETQYYGMAAIAMAFLGIRPALTGILFLERWERVRNPLVALTDAHIEIQLASNEITQKHGVIISISDEDKRSFKWECLIPEKRKPRDMN